VSTSDQAHGGMRQGQVGQAPSACKVSSRQGPCLAIPHFAFSHLSCANNLTVMMQCEDCEARGRFKTRAYCEPSALYPQGPCRHGFFFHRQDSSYLFCLQTALPHQLLAAEGWQCRNPFRQVPTALVQTHLTHTTDKCQRSPSWLHKTWVQSLLQQILDNQEKESYDIVEVLQTLLLLRHTPSPEEVEGLKV
jgi:hypothetical protein